jgi:DNA-binding NarL/FixJ family response regulator
MSTVGEILSQREWDHLAEQFALPPRQQEIVQLLFRGLGDKQMATKLGIALPTVRTHMGRLFAKLGARDRSEVLLRMFLESRRLCSTVKCPLRD